MDSQKLDTILREPCGVTLLLQLCFSRSQKMSSEAISEHLISKNLAYGSMPPDTPLVLHHAHTHVTPLAKILATGLVALGFCEVFCAHFQIAFSLHV